MKTKLKLLAASCLLTAICLSGHAQGSLTPLGAPAPTMKTLSQIEPRTAITNTAGVTITNSGSYYLTVNILISPRVANASAIIINANNVTLDLNGFTISSTESPAGTGAGILLTAVTNISIVNGYITSGVVNNSGAYSGTGFGYGIMYSGALSSNVRVHGVSVTGVLDHGIYLGTGNSTVVDSCMVNVASSYGIYADSVADSTALNCGSYGIYCDTAHNCTGGAVGGGTGLLALSVATACRGFSLSGTGLNASSGVATGCYGSCFLGVGLSAFLANGCHAVAPSGTPFVVTHNANSF